MEAPGFWEKPEQAQEVVGRLKSLRSVIVPWGEIASGLEDVEVLFELALEEEDETSLEEVARELGDLTRKVHQRRRIMARTREIDQTVAAHLAARGRRRRRNKIARDSRRRNRAA